MDYQDLSQHSKSSAAITLIRGDHFAMIMSFLHIAFKRDHIPAVTESRLHNLLGRHLDEIHEFQPGAYPRSPREYLDSWCDSAHRYLRKYRPEKAEEAFFELTAETEKVFQWLESLKPAPFVGTESKLKRIFSLLAEILDNSTRAPDVRIQRLQNEQRKLEEQISKIRETGVVDIYTPTMLNERFTEVLETARQLLGDFRAVEENFRDISREIVIRRTQAGITKGAIVGHTLDAQTQLRQSDQGQSFYSFWEFLLAPGKREELLTLIQSSQSLPELRPELKGEGLLAQLQPRLIADGTKVVQSNQQLATQLRRVLDAQQSQERQALLEMIQAIKRAALAVRNAPPETGFLEIDDDAGLFSTMDRPNWSPDIGDDFTHITEVGNNSDTGEALNALLNLQGIDIDALRRQLSDCLMSRVQITLAELLELQVDTKFIERNNVVLKGLLDEILPSFHRTAEEEFESRYGLRSDMPFIRFRFLDEAARIIKGFPVSELAVPVPQFNLVDLTPLRCIVTENLTNYLAMPSFPGTVCIWGRGNAVGLLKEALWLRKCVLIYWGDIDAFGFHILARLRNSFPNARSVMMDLETLEAFRAFVVTGNRPREIVSSGLTATEQSAYESVRKRDHLLEQEKITWQFACDQIENALNDAK